MTPARLLVGAMAGLIATAPMTLVMLGLSRLLPASERYAPPQQEITDAVTGNVGTHDDRDAVPDPAPAPDARETLGLLATAAHFGYGAGAGAAYAALTGREVRRPVLRGAVGGLLLWAISYLGWLPMMGILKPATKQPLPRNAVMIAAHLAWGALTGALLARRT